MAFIFQAECHSGANKTDHRIRKCLCVQLHKVVPVKWASTPTLRPTFIEDAAVGKLPEPAFLRLTACPSNVTHAIKNLACVVSGT